MEEMLYGKTDLEKFVCFIKEFKENLSQYKRVVIRIDFPDKHHNSLDYEGKKAIKKYSDEILNTMIQLGTIQHAGMRMLSSLSLGRRHCTGAMCSMTQA